MTLASCFRRATSSASPRSDLARTSCATLPVLSAACVSDHVVHSEFDALIFSDHSAKPAGATSSISSKNECEELTKPCRLRTQRPTVEWRRLVDVKCDRRSRSAASRYTVSNTGLRLSPCRVPMVVANEMIDAARAKWR